MKSLLWSLLLAGSLLYSTGGNDTHASSLQDSWLITAQSSSIQSQSHSRIRTTIKGPDGKTVPVELSVRLQNNGTGEALLSLRKAGVLGDLVLALPEAALAPDDLADFVVMENATTTMEMHFTTIGVLRAGNEHPGLSLHRGNIDDDTPAILLKSGDLDKLEVRLRLRDRARLGRIFVTLEGANGWTSVLSETSGLPYELGACPSRLRADALRTSGRGHSINFSILSEPSC